MSTKLTYIIIIGLILVSAALSIYFYPSLPGQMASHWNAAGKVDGYTDKFWGAFLFPMLISILFIIFFIAPKIDPLQENIKKFRKEYNLLILFIIIFLLFFNALTFLWNIGLRFEFSRFAAMATGILFFIIGLILPKTKPNWFMGIRTPWTISSENVWKKTHRLGGLLFKISGVLALIGALLPSKAFFITIIPIIASSLWVIIYSYLEYRKEKSADANK